MGRIVTLLSHYYRPDEDPEIIRAQAADWYAVLKGFPTYAIERACIDYLASEPRRKPAPGAIVELCRKIMPRPRLGRDDDERLALPRPAVNPLAAQLIVERAGFTAKRMEATRTRRMATSEAELYGAKDEPKKPHWTETVAPDDPEMEALRRARAANPLMAQAIAAAKKSEDAA